MLKIYHSQGARSLRVLWLCEEMGVPYETAEASFFKPSDEFKAVNPLRTVPAMTDGDVSMIESVAMMIYIMSKHGPTDLEVKPNEPGYADYLQYLMFGEAGIAAYGNPLVATRFLAPDDQKQNWTVEYLTNAIVKRLEFVCERLGDKQYVAANRFTAADISVSYIVNAAKFGGIDEKIPARMRAYYDNLAQRPAFQRAAAVK
ncbi:MAG TPA: glutathione S-transferase family protein [Vitreimonas sp.]|uniref:glutathione S-transferase family protein n=1 Tax=Vitreimonas sp. TaxID=3069702 RepID=UPI002D39BD49|nr:glutathione S-transferase family protein [Vitreimonas sp.]HYD89573.1 glutathione S-transferase family protein [Vitreimonas sp.]